MSKKVLIDTKQRDEDIGFRLYKLGNAGYGIAMFSNVDGRESEYGTYKTEEDARADFDNLT